MSDSVSEHDDMNTNPCPAIGNLIDHPAFGKGRIKEIRRGGSQLLVHFLKDDCQRWVLFSETGISPSPSAANQPPAVADPDPTSTKIGATIDHPLLGRGQVLQTRLNSSELLVRFIEDDTTRWIQPASKQSSEPSKPSNTTDSIDPRQSNTNLAKSAQSLSHPSTARTAHDSLFSHTENKDVGRTNTPQVADAPSADQVNGSEEDLAREKHTDLGETGSANQYAAQLPLGQADEVSLAIESLLASRNSPMSAHEIADDLILEFITIKEILSALRNTEKFCMLNNGCFDLKARHSRKLDTEEKDSPHSVSDSETGPNPDLPELMSLQSLRVLPVSSTTHKTSSTDLLPGSAEGKNESIWAQDSSELSSHPSESPELLKENPDDGQECDEGITIGSASSVQEKEISKDEIVNEENIDQSDPSFAELVNHFGLSTRAKKVLKENVSSIQELLELDRKKLATFPDCGSKSMDEIMEFVRDIDPKSVSNLGGIQTSHKGSFDDRMITLSDTPPCKETLDLLPIFSSEKIEYLSEDELHLGYNVSQKISELPFSTRVKRYLNAMRFTTLGKLLLSVDSDLLEYRYFQRSDLREVQRVVRDSLIGPAVPASRHVLQSSACSQLKGVESAIEFEHASNSAIDPEDVVAWLVTQPNANGTLYLENVVRQYMWALRAAPAKLQLPIVFDVVSIFTCHTPEELNAYWNLFRAAPNYKQVNSSTSGMLSAGMRCYMRYLQHLSDELTVEKPNVVQLIERHNLEYVDKRDSGGALWVIGGRELSPTMLILRDSGFLFTFKAGGGRSSDYRDAWWYKFSETVSGKKSEKLEEAQPVCTERKGITHSAQRVEGESGPVSLTDSIDHTAQPSDSRELLKGRPDDCRGCRKGGIFGEAFSVQAEEENPGSQVSPFKPAVGVTYVQSQKESAYGAETIARKNDPGDWKEVIFRAELSVRATNVLLKHFSSRDELLSFDKNSFGDLRNCGRKTVDELIEFRDRIIARSGEIPQPAPEVLSPTKSVEDELKLQPSEENIAFLPIFSSKRLTSFAVNDLHPAFHGAASLEDFVFSVRTSKTLRRLGLRTVGEVMLFLSSDLLSQKNFGRNCLREVQDFIRSFVLSGDTTPIAVGGIENSDIDPDIDYSSYEKLVASFVRHCLESKRDQEIICNRLDFPGDMPTLEQLKERFGITRERVRQILKKGNELLRVKVHCKLLADFWERVARLIREGGGITSIQDLSESLQKEYEWPDLPNPVALVELLAVAEGKEDFVVSGEVIAVPCPCLACEMPREYLQMLDFEANESYHLVVVGDRLARHCQSHCQTSPPREFHKAFIEKIVADSGGEYRVHGDLVFQQDRWLIRHGKKLAELIVHILEDNGTPMHFSEIASAIRKENSNYREISDHNVHSAMMRIDSIEIIQRGTYGLRTWGAGGYQSVSKAIEKLLDTHDLPMRRSGIIKQLDGQFSEGNVSAALNNWYSRFIGIGEGFYDRPERWKERSVTGFIELLPEALRNLARYVTTDNNCSYKLVLALVYFRGMDERGVFYLPALKDRFYNFYFGRHKKGQMVEADNVLVSRICEPKAVEIKDKAIEEPMNGFLNSGFWNQKSSSLCLQENLVALLVNPDVHNLLLITLLKGIDDYFGMISPQGRLCPLIEPVMVSQAKEPIATPPEPALDPEVIEKLTDVLSSHFANGYRLNSPIESARFRSFAVEDLGDELTLTDDELKRCIAACGTTFYGKVYVMPARAKERIKEMAEDYFADGAQIIFFAEFYARNESWLFEASVVSEYMLIGILRRLFPKLSFTQTYFGYTNVSVFAALEGEILRVWGDDVLLTYGQLAERLRYIPLERIKSLLGQNGDFIWSSMETYSHISRIIITAEERQVIREASVRECNARGYASITELPLDEVEERNYELSITALHNAVYRICLSDKFDKKGKIVARKGDVLDALTILKEYCRTIDKCSLDDLLTYEKELTGEVQRWIPLEAGNTVLVRIDKNTYVADRYVHFNADIIDEAIGLFAKGDYLPLKSFTTFGAFPDCGQAWNLFLLESYCRRFSRKFRFDTPSVNSRNAGAVIRKNCGMDYTEIMTDAVANADVPLKDTAVGKFLYESGYTGKSTTSKVSEIIDKAKAIREKKD